MPHTEPSTAQPWSWNGLPRILFAPLPLGAVNPILGHIAAHVAHTRPAVFDRLGEHAQKRFLIDPTDLPFVLVLKPEPHRPRLIAHRRHDKPEHDARVAGAFLDLLEMMDSSLDGDALFFSRSLVVTGDTEAVVALRNALDDVDGSVLETALAAFGPLAGPAGVAIAALRWLGRRDSQG